MIPGQRASGLLHLSHHSGVHRGSATDPITERRKDCRHRKGMFMTARSKRLPEGRRLECPSDETGVFSVGTESLVSETPKGDAS